MMRRILSQLICLFAVCACIGVALAEDPPATAPPPAGTEIVHPVDGAIMVWVPAGPFVMGMDQDEADTAVKALGFAGWEEVWAWEWFPRREVQVAGYFVDKYEVTRERWDRFAATEAYRPVEADRAKGATEKVPGEYALYPIARVYWAEAQQYANWAGKSLPTEAQWEKAARGTDGRVYPWGNEPPTEKQVNPRPSGSGQMFRMVGSYPAGASPYGCLDMAGNVYEWTSEFMEPYPNNPERARMIGYTGHATGCLRGGSFYHATHAYITAKRFGFKPEETYYHVGFRTVWQPPADYFTSPDYAAARAAVATRHATLDALRAAANPTHPTAF